MTTELDASQVSNADERRSRYQAFLDNDDLSNKQKEELAKDLLQDLLETELELEDRRLEVNAIYRISRECGADSVIMQGKLLKKLLELAVERPFKEDKIVPDYSLRASHNMLVHNKQLIDELNEDELYKLIQFLEQEEIYEDFRSCEEPRKAILSAVKVMNVALSRPWYSATVSLKEQQRVMQFIETLIERLLPPKEAANDSWEMTDELAMAFCSALQALETMENGPASIYTYALRAILAAKVDTRGMNHPLVRFACSLLTCCEPPQRGSYREIQACAEKISCLLIESLKELVDQKTGELKSGFANTVSEFETTQAPIWILLGLLAERSVGLRECIESHFFRAADNAKPTDRPTVPAIEQLNHMMSSKLFPLLSFAVGNAMFMLSDKNARLLLDRFGFELSAGILFTIGEEMKLERQQQEQAYEMQFGEPPDEFSKPGLSGIDEEMSAEQFCDMITSLGGKGIIDMENPISRAHAEGVLEQVEDQIQKLDLKAAEEEDKEIQKAVDEWAESKLRRAVPEDDAPEFSNGK
ncbi:hypothetical protein MPSI1_001795 [Malassezia psittaci]|uniref:Uncharacterized protein n=1 Tax=Malassezia psittaci TaxID=1821823 RepID=A0AAF0F9D0_9BASI|nr:hypothetical protein MPSI1_001795 [Malassezia psittaci]